jgi:hypothetical protein
MTGFFTGYGYRPAGFARGDASASAAPPAQLFGDGGDAMTPIEETNEQDESDETIEFDSGLSLEEHALDEDENGLFVSGTIINKSDHGYDAVRVTFDLCDAEGRAYSGVTDVTYDRMAPGDSWGFTIYIPYSEMRLFSSYRLQSIIGATR